MAEKKPWKKVHISNLVRDEWISHTEHKGEKSVSNMLETNHMTEAGNV